MIHYFYSYRKDTELAQHVGKMISFIGWEDMPPYKGILTFDGKDYLLNFCGKVKANTVRVAFNPLYEKDISPYKSSKHRVKRKIQNWLLELAIRLGT